MVVAKSLFHKLTELFAWVLNQISFLEVIIF